MGDNQKAAPAMQQTSSFVMATHTWYEFRQNGVTLEFSFFTPAMMNDLDLLSRPVTYLTWNCRATDGAKHQVSIMLEVDPVIAVNDRSQPVVSLRKQTSLLNVLSAGSRDQNVLNRSGDNLRIDWGYFHLAVPKDEQSQMAIAPHPDEAFVKLGSLAASDTVGMPEPADGDAPHLAAILDFASVGAQPVNTPPPCLFY